MPIHHLIALSLALIALLASIPTPLPDPYAASPLLAWSGDGDR